MYAEGLYSRSKIGAFLAIAVALAAMPRATLAGGWVEFTEESTTRMIADNGVGMDDFEEKAFGVGDVDGDGDDDLVVVRKIDEGSEAGPLRNVLFLNEDGVLVDHTAELIPGFLAGTTDRDVVLADVDGDGWLDIVTAQAFGGVPKIYMNQGEVDGQWQGFVYEAARIPLSGSPNFCGVAAGDIDNQNGPELYFVAYFGSIDKLLLNDGNGFFTDVTTQRLSGFEVSGFGTAVEIVDMNGDGKLDIIKSEAGPVYIAFNDGTGFFNVTQTAYTGAAYHMTTFDIENDGDLDFYVSDDGTDRYAINVSTNPNGTVQFVEYTAASSTNGFGSDILIADFNNDEFDDLMVADVDVDLNSCGGTADLLRNTGVSGPGNLIDTLPLGSLTPQGVHDQAAIDLNEDGWLDLIVGKCTGYDIFINLPPEGIIFSYPQGLPTLLPPFEDLTLQVKLLPFGDVTIDPDSPTLFLSLDGGAFESQPLQFVGDDIYEAVLPGAECMTRYDFYALAALTTGGEFTDPNGAPASTNEALAALGTEIMLRDEMEGDVSDWTIISKNLLSGEWEQADPNGTVHSGNLAAPEGDAGAESTMAFVTENGLPGGSPIAADVDGGPLFLISPAIDLDGTDGTISYARWMYSASGDVDLLTVDVSNDDGKSWVAIPEHTTSSTGQQWEVVSFLVSDYVEPTATVKVRFTAIDDPNDSVTEAGIDNFQVEVFICSDEQPCEGDANGDGVVDPLDSGYVLARFGCPVGTGDPDCDSADQNGDGGVDPLDSGFVLARFGECE
ncbi:MAG: VCBS repeat-containing protein [Planctomycetes bacterium]|nr:VCBS repeat-containing protein [Planctomycetota bacterium]